MESGADNRTEGRSNVFLTATLDAGGASSTVRIRNISARGALIEGASLPAVGTEVRLVRGSLSASGQFAWQGHGHGGVNFDSRIDVERWVQRVGHAGQQRVDGVVDAIRRSETVPVELHGAPLAETLTDISVGLERICERLATAEGMSVEFAEDLLKLDAIAQTLRRLARIQKR